MNEQIFLIVVISLVVLILVGLFIFANKTYRMSHKKAAVDNTSSSLTPFNDSTLNTPAQQIDNVIIHLNFTESLDPVRFANASYEHTLNDINRELASRSADGVVVVIQSLVLNQSGVQMTVSASMNGQQLISEGTAVIARHASGRTLPILKDLQTGRIIEQMKGVPTARVLSRVGAMSAMIVGAAHIIAGADISKKLTIIDSKINLLLAYRRIEQMAKLERIYTSAKELLTGPPNEKKILELWRLRTELRELRSIWRNELKHHLNLIDDPNSVSWLKKTFTRTISTDRNVQGKITEGQLQLYLIEYSLRLDHVLSVAGGTIHKFEKTLSDELYELENVTKLLESKSKFISGKYPDLTVEPTVKGINALVEGYKTLLPEMTVSPNSELTAQILKSD